MWTARLLVLASLFAPAALGEFGSLELVCVLVFESMFLCRCGHKNTPFAFCDWHHLNPYHNFILFLFKCQILSANCDKRL